MTQVGNSDAPFLGSFEDRQRYFIETQRVQLDRNREDGGRIFLRNVGTSLSLPRRHSHKFSPQKRSSFGSDKSLVSHPLVYQPLVGLTQQQGTVLTLRDLPSSCSPVSINNASHLLVVPSLVMTHQFVCLLPEEKHFNGTADYRLWDVLRTFPNPFILLIHRAASDGHPYSAQKQQNEGNGKRNTGGPRLSYNRTAVYYTFSPLIRPSNAEFGLSYAASEQTFRANAQWHSKTEFRTVFCVF